MFNSKNSSSLSEASIVSAKFGGQQEPEQPRPVHQAQPVMQAQKIQEPAVMQVRMPNQATLKQGTLPMEEYIAGKAVWERDSAAMHEKLAKTDTSIAALLQSMGYDRARLEATYADIQKRGKTIYRFR